MSDMEVILPVDQRYSVQNRARLHVIRVADNYGTRSQGSQTGGGSHSTRREDITLAPESQQLLMELGDEHQACVVHAIVAAHLS